MVVQDRKATDINGEDPDELFESIFNPLFAMRVLFPTQESPPDTPGNAVVERGDRGINQNFPSRSYDVSTQLSDAKRNLR